VGKSCLPFEHVSDGCLSSVGMVREASALADAEVVEHEERGEVAEHRGSYGPSNDGSSTLLGFDGENALSDGSGENGHGWLWWWLRGEETSRED